MNDHGGHILSKLGPSIFGNGPSIFGKCRDPPKTANFGGKKLFLVSEKNFPVRKWVCHVLFAKKMEKFRQIWPQQPLKHFTAAYRGSPPCTQSQHPINRETGNSNVLWVRWASCNVSQFESSLFMSQHIDFAGVKSGLSSGYKSTPHVQNRAILTCRALSAVSGTGSRQFSARFSTKRFSQI